MSRGLGVYFIKSTQIFSTIRETSVCSKSQATHFISARHNATVLLNTMGRNKANTLLHCNNLTELTDGISTLHSSPPSLQLICSATFWTTLRSLGFFEIVMALMTCDGTGHSTQQSFLMAL